MVGQNLAHLHPSTADLSSDVLAKTKEFIYCCRNGAESVVLVTPDKSVLQSLVGNIPEQINTFDTNLYYVDIASIGTDKLRLYVRSPEENICGVGFYFDANGNLLEKKIYKGKGLSIDRFNSEGNLISENEKESICTKNEWGGSASLANNIEAIASENNYTVIYLKKNDKNQSYIRVHKNG